MDTCSPELPPGLDGSQVSGWPVQLRVDGIWNAPPEPTVTSGVTQATHLSSSGFALASPLT